MIKLCAILGFTLIGAGVALVGAIAAALLDALPDTY